MRRQTPPIVYAIYGAAETWPKARRTMAIHALTWVEERSLVIVDSQAMKVARTCGTLAAVP